MGRVARVAQLVEQRYRKPRVRGSSPLSGSRHLPTTVETSLKELTMADSTRAHSRIIKKQRRTILKQTFVWFAVGITVLLAFLFFLLPNSAQLLTLITDASLPTNQDTIPPQAPVFNAPVTITNQAQLDLSGFAESDSRVLLVINGGQLPEMFASSEGTFAQTITLTEGENSISAFSVDVAENVSQPSRTFIVVLDTVAPEILLEGVEPEMTIEGRDNKIFRLVGLTKPESKVTINDRFLFARADGSFQYDISLNEGENTIAIEVVDKAGNSATTQFLIRYRQ